MEGIGHLVQVKQIDLFNKLTNSLKDHKLEFQKRDQKHIEIY